MSVASRVSALDGNTFHPDNDDVTLPVCIIMITTVLHEGGVLLHTVVLLLRVFKLFWTILVFYLECYHGTVSHRMLFF